MQSFLERFYDDVDDNLDDPHTSKRVTKAKKLHLLHVAEKMIWERILMLSGQESIPGYVETPIEIVGGRSHYRLPGNFRQFLGLERRVDDSPLGAPSHHYSQYLGDSNRVTARLRSIPLYDVGPGVRILSEQRGMIVVPTPSLSETETWTLIYQKGPVKLHYAVISGTFSVGGHSCVSGRPYDIPDAGDLIPNDDYYRGSLLRIYDDPLGPEQTRQILNDVRIGGPGSPGERPRKNWSFQHPFDPVPAADAKYEIRPLLPPDYDDLYAMDVAIRILGRRGRNRGRVGLKTDRNDLWQACKGYFLSNVADRAPARIVPYDPDEVDPYD